MILNRLTLFDDPDDDLFDGDLGENDTEIPRIQIKCQLHKIFDPKLASPSP
jgi:hypothetical protein